MLFTLTAVKDAARRGASPFWFSADSLRFFGSNIHREVWAVPDGALFVTSEKVSPDAIERRFSVRHCTDGGNITTVGEFLEHGSLTAARMAAVAEASRRSGAAV